MGLRTFNTSHAAHAAGATGQRLGFVPSHEVFWNLGAAALVERAVLHREVTLGEGGTVVAITTPHTGRSPNDKFVVEESSSKDRVSWGAVNQPLSENHYRRIKQDVLVHLAGQPLYVREVFAGADPAYTLPVRFVTPRAWAALFVNNMFLRPTPAELEHFTPGFTVLHAPDWHADPATHGTRSSTCIVINFGDRTIIIGGTRYAGELKKSVFTILNYLLPVRGVFSMHCSANIGERGDVALFFGLSGTGKTTISTDAERRLIGDDEHGWSDQGVFNFEGGCYAKVIRLSPEGEPEIYATTRRFGTILENVVADPATRQVDLNDDRITENTRASYPIDFIPNHEPTGRGGHPRHVVFLTCDAYGVMPPIARLTAEQAMYHFLSGYTAKVAGTERGVTQPKETFSACFGAPFLPLHPHVYAEMLGKKLATHQVQCWLVNTGWTGGPYGTGSRVKLAYTRAMVRAALSGQLDSVPATREPVFGLAVPSKVPGVPVEALLPRATWADPAAYDAQAARLAELFRKNFEKFTTGVPDAVRQAGPRL
jgi:phosphoenolpyruvate carboxykinase (ATP)